MTDNDPPQRNITCTICGRENVPDWDGQGHCIKDARDLVLGDELDKILAFGNDDPTFIHDIHVLIGEGRVPKAKEKLRFYMRRQALQANIELIEELLDAQDQEVDLDGRPTTKPYYVFNGDGERFKLESILEQLQKQLTDLEAEGGV